MIKRQASLALRPSNTVLRLDEIPDIDAGRPRVTRKNVTNMIWDTIIITQRYN